MYLFSISNIICVKMSHYTNGLSYLQNKTTKLRMAEGTAEAAGAALVLDLPGSSFTPRAPEMSHLPVKKASDVRVRIQPAVLP